jgi:DNA-binding transcriptional ArsR family regulator
MSSEGNPGSPPPRKQVTDARAMRALAHPVRVTLLDWLAHTGTLTATQASELLGESPATCAFHLRTLAKYGYVEEAGGGRGRERPWRRAYQSLTVSADADGSPAAQAAAEFAQFWLDTVLARARSALSQTGLWPRRWDRAELGQRRFLAYVTPDEARQLIEETDQLLRRYADRIGDPARRPPGAEPVEILQLSYLLTHLARGPEPEEPERKEPDPCTPN